MQEWLFDRVLKNIMTMFYLVVLLQDRNHLRLSRVVAVHL